jgi:hypothetical protein
MPVRPLVSCIRLGAVALVQQFVAAGIAHLLIYKTFLVPRLSSMHSIGWTWIFVLCLPTLAVSIRLSKFAARVGLLAMLAGGSASGVMLFLFVGSVFDLVGLRKVPRLDFHPLYWMTGFVVSLALFFVVIGASSSVRNFILRRRPQL